MYKRQGCNPQPFLEKITDDMAEQEFLYQVRTYLASFGIIGHVSFHDKKSGPKGFLLRISDQEMFVEEANQDTGLQVGDRILSLDAVSYTHLLCKTYRLADYLKKHQDRLQVIAEVKKASPSLGDINLDVDIVQQAQTYEANGAVMISVLTDEVFFKGHLDYLREISSQEMCIRDSLRLSVSTLRLRLLS